MRVSPSSSAEDELADARDFPPERADERRDREGERGGPEDRRPRRKVLAERGDDGATGDPTIHMSVILRVAGLILLMFMG